MEPKRVRSVFDAKSTPGQLSLNDGFFASTCAGKAARRVAAPKAVEIKEQSFFTTEPA